MSSSWCRSRARRRPGRGGIRGLGVPGASALLAVLLLGGRAAAKDAAVSRGLVRGDLGRALDQAVRQADPGLAGSILCARGGVVYLAKGYGLADRRSRAPNTDATLYDIASVAKQFTAAAVLNLVGRGDLSLDDPISRHLAGVPENKKAITVRHLLQHTSGLSPWIPPQKMNPQIAADREAVVRVILGVQPVSGAGQRFAYNNMGYILLAAIVERASGESFGPLLKKRLFHPMGMRDTSFCGDAALDKKRASTRYFRPDDKDAILGPTGPASAVAWDFSWGNRGPTSIASSVWDMYRWSRAVVEDALFDPSIRTEWTKAKTGRYALGWQVQRSSGGTPKYFHSGSTVGYFSLYGVYPKENATIVLLSNKPGRHFRVFLQCERILLGTEPAPPVTTRQVYGADGDGFVVEKAGSSLALTPRSQSEAFFLARGREPDAKEADGLKIRNERAIQVARALASATAPTPGHFTDTAAATRIARSWKQTFPSPKAKVIELVGSWDLGAELMTYVCVRTEEGPKFWRFRWSGDRVESGSPAGTEHPFKVRARAVSDGRFEVWTGPRRLTIATAPRSITIECGSHRRTLSLTEGGS